MSHKVNLNKYKIRSDLAVDSFNNKKEKDIFLTNIFIDKRYATMLGKKEGNYLTIEFNDITDNENYMKVKKIFKSELRKLIKKLEIKDDDKCLIVGLGNRNLLPDSLGIEVTEKIIVTEHIYKLNKLDDNYRRVCIFNPDVFGNTGIESIEIIKKIVDITKVNFVIIIDSLITNSKLRINKAIQITDTGISPGSGIHNSKELNNKVLGIPTIAIGVPLVLNTGLKNFITVTNDLDYQIKKFSLLISSSINEILHKQLSR